MHGNLSVPLTGHILVLLNLLLPYKWPELNILVTLVLLITYTVTASLLNYSDSYSLFLVYNRILADD